MKNYILAHGFNVKDGGKGTVDKLVPLLNGRVQQADYGWFGLSSVLLHNDKIAQMITGMATPDSVGIGHSNGCALLVKAAQNGTRFKRLILINPALQDDIEIPSTVGKVYVLHNKFDLPVKAARLLNWFVPGRNFLWGQMGNSGYQGDDPRVVNLNLSDYVNGHSAVFSARNFHWFASVFKLLLLDKVPPYLKGTPGSL